MSVDKYAADDYISYEATGSSYERIEQLQRQVNYIARSLWFVQTEVEMTINDIDYAEELKDLVLEIKKHVSKIEDVWIDRHDN